MPSLFNTLLSRNCILKIISAVQGEQALTGVLVFERATPTGWTLEPDRSKISGAFGEA